MKNCIRRIPPSSSALPACSRYSISCHPPILLPLRLPSAATQNRLTIIIPGFHKRIDSHSQQKSSFLPVHSDITTTHRLVNSNPVAIANRQPLFPTPYPARKPISARLPRMTQRSPLTPSLLVDSDLGSTQVDNRPPCLSLWSTATDRSTSSPV